MFRSLLVINYYKNYLIDNIFNGFYATRKIIQMFSVFSVFTQIQKNKSIANLYQKELLGCFLKTSK